jgi:hypothetical protein
MNDTLVVLGRRQPDSKAVWQRCRTELQAQADALTAAADQLFAHMKLVGFTLESVWTRDRGCVLPHANILP